jgi:hypothetical protein
MQPSKWTPELGLLLKELRQNAGLDIAILARRQIVSTSQVRQLESGGDAAFYSPDIKYAIGKKLLLSLGHAIDTDPSPAPVVQESVNQAQALEASAASAALVAGLAAMTATAPSVATFAPVSMQPKPRFFKLWMGLFVMALTALVVAGIYFKFALQAVDLPQGSGVAQVTVVPQAMTAAMTSATTAAEPTPEPPTTPTPTPTPTLMPTEAPTQTAAPSTSCKWSDLSVALQPSATLKSAEYVHVVATGDATVCIMDGQQRVATLNLSTGTARSIYGPPPFKVYSADLPLLKLYFQGQLMKLPSDDVRHVQLTAATAP